MNVCKNIDTVQPKSTGGANIDIRKYGDINLLQYDIYDL